jgi:hypothetical protein
MFVGTSATTVALPGVAGNELAVLADKPLVETLLL